MVLSSGGDRRRTLVLVIDNYDSFTYNLVQYLGELGADLLVKRNDEISLENVEEIQPDRIVISPGPGRPEEAGVSVGVVRRYGSSVPILGVCLGHQAVGYAFGATIVSAPVLVHGKSSEIQHDERGVFRGIASPFSAGRYHSLVVSEEGWPEDLEVSARTIDGSTIMGIRHRTWPVHGVQFHPESVLTDVGKTLLGNFLER